MDGTGGGDDTSAERAPTRERLIEAALALFGEHGYHATSVDEILDAADAHTGSFYHHFGSKEGLLIAALERRRDRLEADVIRPAWEAVDDPVERIFALLDRYRASLVETDFAYASLVGGLAAELRRPSPVVRHKLAQNLTVWRRAVERCLDEAGDRLPADADPAELAGLVLMTLEGALLVARTYRQAAAFDAGAARLRDYFGRLEAAASGE